MPRNNKKPPTGQFAQDNILSQYLNVRPIPFPSQIDPNHTSAQYFLSPQSLSQKLRPGSLSGSSNLFWNISRQASVYPSRFKSNDSHLQPAFLENCSHLPLTLNAHKTLQGVFSPFSFANCLLLQNPEACQSDAVDDKNYPSRAPLPLLELMWSI